jgi:hypothetical protein
MNVWHREIEEMQTEWKPNCKFAVDFLMAKKKRIGTKTTMKLMMMAGMMI